MHAGRHYSLREVISWTKRESAVFLLIALVPTALYALAGWRWLAAPWPPLAVVGTAVAFMTGFKNNASYARLWEARQIWGAIINVSRAFGVLVLDTIPGEAARRRIFERHIAWLTALRYQLREPRAWENMARSHNVEYRRANQYQVAEWSTPLEGELAALLSGEEKAHVLERRNPATQLIHLQIAGSSPFCGRRRGGRIAAPGA